MIQYHTPHVGASLVDARFTTNNPTPWEMTLRVTTNGQPQRIAPTKILQTDGKPQRKSIRLKGYDYSQAGAYFITICTQHRAHLFGEIVDGVMRLNDAGHMIEQWYGELANKFPDIECGEYIVMPNHFHAVVIIVGADLCVCPSDNPCDMGMGAHTGAPLRGADIPSVVQWFKTMTTNAYIRGVKQSGWSRFNQKLWQRNYWEHIVRNEQEFERISRYICNNPAQWQHDQLNPRRGNHCGCPNHQEAWMT